MKNNLNEIFCLYFYSIALLTQMKPTHFVGYFTFILGSYFLYKSQKSKL